MALKLTQGGSPAAAGSPCIQKAKVARKSDIMTVTTFDYLIPGARETSMP